MINTLFKIIIVFAIYGSSFAQNTMYVKEATGTKTSFPLTSISKITFSSGSMHVHKTDNTNTDFTLSNISRYNFSNTSTGISVIKNKEIHSLFVFPNPGVDDVQLMYQLLSGGTITIDIIDSRGKVVFSQLTGSVKGKNQTTINVAKLSNGLYLFRLKRNDDFETINFLKN